MPFGPKVLKKIVGVNTGDLIPVPDFDGYYATRDGRVFCLRELSQQHRSDGYMRVSLGGATVRKNKSGRHGAGVHRLMALAMLPRMDGQTVVRHLDGNKLNNALENLAWGTPQENSRDMVGHGTSTRGERNHKAILTKKQVLKIRTRVSDGEERKNLAREFGVCRKTVDAVVVGQNWGWLENG